jgi:hypothetical protein
MVQLSAIKCSCICILWVSLVSVAAIKLCVASQRVFIVVSVYFVIDPVRKRLDTPSYLVGPFRPMVGQSEHHVKNSEAVISELHNISLQEAEFCRGLTIYESPIWRWSRDSSASIAARLRAGRSRFYISIPGGEVGNFYLHHHVQNGSGVHPASYPMGTGGSFPGGEAAGAWSWPLTSV